MKYVVYLGLMGALAARASTPQIIVDPSSISDQKKYEVDAYECLEIARTFDLSGATGAKVVSGALIGGGAVAGVAKAVAGAFLRPRCLSLSQVA